MVSRTTPSVAGQEPLLSVGAPPNLGLTEAAAPPIRLTKGCSPTRWDTISVYFIHTVWDADRLFFSVVSARSGNMAIRSMLWERRKDTIPPFKKSALAG